MKDILMNWIFFTKYRFNKKFTKSWRCYWCPSRWNMFNTNNITNCWSNTWSNSWSICCRNTWSNNISNIKSNRMTNSISITCMYRWLVITFYIFNWYWLCIIRWMWRLYRRYCRISIFNETKNCTKIWCNYIWWYRFTNTTNTIKLLCVVLCCVVFF